MLNIRGNDDYYAPIPYCFILIDKNKNIQFFCDLKKLSKSFKKYFYKIKFISFDEIEKVLSEIKQKKFIIDKSTCSFFLENIILRNNKILNHYDLIYNLKSIKNKKEIKNIKAAHIYDGVALTKYLFWVKKNFEKENF